MPAKLNSNRPNKMGRLLSFYYEVVFIIIADMWI